MTKGPVQRLETGFALPLPLLPLRSFPIHGSPSPGSVSKVSLVSSVITFELSVQSTRFEKHSFFSLDPISAIWEPSSSLLLTTF